MSRPGSIEARHAAAARLDPAASHDDDRDQRQEDDGCGRYGESRDAKGAACRLVGPVFVANRDFAGFFVGHGRSTHGGGSRSPTRVSLRRNQGRAEGSRCSSEAVGDADPKVAPRQRGDVLEEGHVFAGFLVRQVPRLGEQGDVLLGEGANRH